MRIADDVQKRRATSARDVRAMLDKPSSDTVFPFEGLDEQGIELRAAIVARHNGREPNHRAITFSNKHVTSRDLLDWNSDGIGMVKQRVAITRIVQ